MGMIRILDDSFKATTDLSAAQYTPVKLGAKGFIAAAAAATDPIFGILLNKPKAGDAAEVAIWGRHFAKVDGSGTAIAIGDLLGPNAAGTMLVKHATADNGVVARALDACTLSGGIIEVLLFAGLPTVFRTLT